MTKMPTLPYGVEYGKRCEDSTPLAFARCPCGMLLLTTPKNHGNRSECASCTVARHSAGQEQRSQHRADGKSLLVLAVIVLCAFGWLGFSMQRTPDRPMSAKEAVGS